MVTAASVGARAGLTGRAAVVGTAVAALVAVVAVAPLAVVLGLARLLVLTMLVGGTWVSARRSGAVDLGAGAVAGVGAYAGAVAPAVIGLSPWLGLVLGALAGGAVGSLIGAANGRVGRVGSAVVTLAAGSALVGSFAVLPGVGGASGFHAVPLLTGSDRLDTTVLLAALVGVVAGIRWFDGTAGAASAAVAIEAPAALASVGVRPTAAAAFAGAASGVVLGLGGSLLGAAAGSVAPGTFGLTLSAGLALAAMLGGAHWLGGVVGALLVFGPAVVWPTVPILGDAPLLAVGPIALLVLAWRPSGVLPARPRRRAGAGPVAPEPAWPPVPLVLERTPTVPGRSVSLRVEPGEVVAVVGPNGAGKSTLLARVAGQLPDHGTVLIGETPAPRGAVARARAGLARSWQQPSGIAIHDLTGHRDVGDDPGARAWAEDVLGADAASPHGQDLVVVAARRPRWAVLDEPGAHLDRAAVTRLVRGLAAGGCAVLLVEHRAEIVASADRVVDLTGGDT